MTVVVARLAIVVAAFGIKPARMGARGRWPRDAYPEDHEKHSKQEPAQLPPPARCGGAILAFPRELSNSEGYETGRLGGSPPYLNRFRAITLLMHLIVPPNS